MNSDSFRRTLGTLAVLLIDIGAWLGIDSIRWMQTLGWISTIILVFCVARIAHSSKSEYARFRTAYEWGAGIGLLGTQIPQVVFLVHGLYDFSLLFQVGGLLCFLGIELLRQLLYQKPDEGTTVVKK